MIRFRDDKFTHQALVSTPQDVDAIAELGWFDETAAWGRKELYDLD